MANAAAPGLTGYLIDAGVSFSGQLVALGLYCGVASLVLAWVARSARNRNTIKTCSNVAENALFQALKPAGLRLRCLRIPH